MSVGTLSAQLKSTPEGFAFVVGGDVVERRGGRPALQEVEVATTKCHHRAWNGAVPKPVGQLLQSGNYESDRVVTTKFRRTAAQRR